jgi:membrane protease subunit (stomatin/prohibitin family)
MVFSFLKGQFIDVIEWLDDSRDTMVHRFERYGNSIMYGAKLTVRDGQMAVFIHEGQWPMSLARACICWKPTTCR